MNLSKNLAKVSLSSLCSSYSKNILVFFDYSDSEFNRSSKNWPYRATACNKSIFWPGIISLNVFAWPKVIRSKCLICFLSVTIKPFTYNLQSCLGVINICPPLLTMVQCLFIIPRAFNLISFSSASLVPIEI